MKDSSRHAVLEYPALLDVSAEKLDRPLPGIRRGFGLVNLFPRVVEERVLRPGIDDDLHVLAHLLQLLLELPSLLGRYAAVSFTIDEEDGSAKIVPIHRHLPESAVEANDRADIRFFRTRVLRQRASHAEADDSIRLR